MPETLFDEFTFLPPSIVDLRSFDAGHWDPEAERIRHDAWRAATAREGWFHYRGWTSWDFRHDSGTPGHGFRVLDCDLRCDWHRIHQQHRGKACQCVGPLLYRHVCDCGWQGEPHASENASAETWLDHAWPGWRDLEPVPLKLRPVDPTNAEKAKLRAWLDEHQPEPFRQRGAPIRTERSGIGTRHVPGGSVFGGYDAAVILDA